jgi:hypothetical protein
MSDTSTEAAWHALMNYQQADMEGIMVLVSRQAIHECKDDRDALAAERDQLRQAVKEANEKLELAEIMAKEAVNLARDKALEESQNVVLQEIGEDNNGFRIWEDDRPYVCEETVYRSINALKTKPTPRQIVQEVDAEAFSRMSVEGKWRHILVEYLDQMRPVPSHFVRWILQATAPSQSGINCHRCGKCADLPITVHMGASMRPPEYWRSDKEGLACPECCNTEEKANDDN